MGWRAWEHSVWFFVTVVEDVVVVTVAAAALAVLDWLACRWVFCGCSGTEACLEYMLLLLLAAEEGCGLGAAQQTAEELLPERLGLRMAVVVQLLVVTVVVLLTVDLGDEVVGLHGAGGGVRGRTRGGVQES